MRLSKVIESLYLKVFVGIVVSAEKYDVVIEILKGSDVKERLMKSFSSSSGKGEMQSFIETYTSESPFYYIALLNPMADQGAIPTCSSKRSEDFLDLSTSITLCQDKQWTLYAAKPDLDQLRREYKKTGLDFIFSPFSVMQRFFKDKITSGLSLFVLAQPESISLTIFQEGLLLFAQQVKMEAEEEDLFDDQNDDNISLSFELDADGLEEGIDLDDINAIDDLEGLDDLNDIEDLDAVGDLESFEEDIPEMAPVAIDKEEATEEPSIEGFNEDFKRFQIIQNSLNSYYSDGKFDQQFIESVYVADGCGVTDDLKHYLEEELFMKVYIRRIDLAAEVVDLAKAEAKYAI
ncbi:MAG: hypothetical protein U9Q62_06550 [Campylobacterota bacterium]|nr:hypothetical protein [Campylobacterota bacterium]